MIYYFTATGNSLYVAKRLGEALDQNLCSIPHFGGQPSRAARSAEQNAGDDVIGVVFPTYAHDAPRLVREFFAQVRPAAAYVFLVATYGNVDGGVAEWSARHAEDAGLRVDYANSVLMVDNWLPSYDAEKQQAMDKNVEGQLEAVISDLRSRRRFIKEAHAEDREGRRRFLEKMAGVSIDTAAAAFAVDDSCTGCGICTRVCPSGAISLPDTVAGLLEETVSVAEGSSQRHRRRRRSDGSGGAVLDVACAGEPAFADVLCAWCLGCINLCPAKAIGFSRLTEANRDARYRNPHISLKEIIASNDQKVSGNRESRSRNQRHGQTGAGC